jgi:23S rRNA G2445 N2-methylase RlmL
VSGFDIDSSALEVAAANRALHRSEVSFFQSNCFQSWKHPTPPDLVFADPPWGSKEDLYEGDRDASYYDKMPPGSAYPANGRIGLHQMLIESLISKQWQCPVVLNLGVIPQNIYETLLPYFRSFRIYQPTDMIRLLVGIPSH